MAFRAMMVGGAIPADERALEQTELRLRDRVSGLSYRLTDPLTIDPAGAPPADQEIINAAATRGFLLAQSGRKLDGVEPDDVARGIPSFLRVPVVDHEASTLEDCERILEEITNASRKLRRFKRLWLRGQRREYFIERAADVLEWLHFGPAGAKVPSLVPSLGRFALKNPGKVNFGYAFAGPSHWWKKPFLVWVIRQNPQWLEDYPEFRERVEGSLRSEDDEVFAKLLVDIMLDPKVVTEVDDLRQWFFAHYKFSAWIWVLQQYGYLASMLDLTTDLNAALFFAQAEMVDGRFSMPDPLDGRVIYVFAEWSNSTLFWDVDRVDWGDSDWARELPARVKTQRAGCLIGSTWFRQNLYGHLVVARIHLKGSGCVTSLRVQDMFPPPHTDLLLRTLLDARPMPEGLYW
jgi:hypothetical protein